MVISPVMSEPVEAGESRVMVNTSGILEGVFLCLVVT
jgi:hypothetical protein